MTSLSLSLLGPFQAGIDDREISGFPTDKVRALLVYLAVEAGRPHRRDALATLLWPEWSDRDALRNLRKSLHRLRQTLDQVVPNLSQQLLEVTPQTVQLNRDVLVLDLSSFQALLAECKLHPHRALHACAACQERLTKAVALYRGEFLAGFNLADAQPFEEWLLIQRENVHHELLLALYSLARRHEDLGAYELARDYAARQLALEPWREEAHRQMMRALALSGQRSQALAHYESCSRILEDELGVEPTAETRRLYEQIRAGELPAVEANEAAEQDGAANQLHHFPAQFTPFMGRQEELSEIVEQLLAPDCRLLTLLGPGGIGKTRLSIQAAERLGMEGAGFEDGIYFVPLAGVATPDLLLSALAAALELPSPEQADPREQLLQHLRRQKAFLVLDNFEHLLAGSDLLVEILAAAPGVKILVTSREALNLHAERRFVVEGLAYPDQESGEGIKAAGHSAIDLFVEAARRVRPRFSPSAEEEAAIVTICQLVGGMPLALEMAASWVRLHDCETIAAEIARGLDFLATSRRDAPDRHRSMRAVFEHSWGLLSATEQVALAQIAVFRGEFTLEAVLGVTDATVSELAALLDKSLLRRTERGRYEMHELLRQFAAGKLERLTSESGMPRLDLARVRVRHADWYLDRVAARMAADSSGSSAQGVGELRREVENIYYAWQWVVEQGDVERIAASLEGLSRFYRTISLPGDGTKAMRLAANRLRLVFNMDSNPDPVLMRTLCRLLIEEARLLAMRGDYVAVWSLAQEAEALAGRSGDHDAETIARTLLGWSLGGQGDYERAITYQEQAQSYYRQTDDRQRLAQTMVQIGIIYWRQNRLDAALRSYGEACELYREIGNQAGLANSLIGLGTAHMELGHYAEALACQEESLTISRQLGRLAATARVLGNLAIIYERTGAYDRALSCTQEALEIGQQLGSQGLIGLWQSNLGATYLALGDMKEAEARLNQALATLREAGDPQDLAEALLRSAELSLHTGDMAAAQRFVREGLQLATALSATRKLFVGQLLAARLLAAQGDAQEAGQQLRALLARYPGDAEQAELHYWLWRLEQSEASAQKALALYRRLHQRTPKVQYKERAEELDQFEPVAD